MARYGYLVLAFTLMPAVGCTSLPLLSGPKVDPVAVANGAQGMVVVEVRAAGKKPQTFQMALESEMHMQDAVEQSKARRKFRRMNISLLRTTPEGRRHRMDCMYESGKKHVAPQYDYALQNGDYIVITEDTSTVLDEIVEEAVKPLGVFNH